MSNDQLRALAKPLPDRFVHKNPSGGGDYVTHSVITQKLLATVGPYDFELVELVRGDLPRLDADPTASSKRGRAGSPELSQVVVGAVCRLTATIDGRTIRIEEIGDCEDPRNWPHDGARLKDAMSDALKRCAMRIGLGLHLWAQGEYVLSAALKGEDEPQSAPPLSVVKDERTPREQAEYTPVSSTNQATAKQMGMIHALAGDGDAHEIAGAVLGREVASLKELSKADASKVIDSLNGKTA